MDQIIGIGTDIEEISRFRRADDSFLKKVLTEQEIRYCRSKKDPYPHFAVRFCAKEAVIKAFSSANIRVFFNEIEIFKKKNGIPYVQLSKDNMDYTVQLSLSHTKDTAIAFVTVTKNIK